MNYRTICGARWCVSKDTIGFGISDCDGVAVSVIDGEWTYIANAPALHLYNLLGDYFQKPEILPFAKEVARERDLLFDVIRNEETRLRRELDTVYENLRAVQSRCGQLLEENRWLKAQLVDKEIDES